MKQQSGFTLIELVMVIVILGIMAASFAPRFVNLESSAETAVTDGARGAVASALVVANAGEQGEPTLAQLATYVQGDNVGTVASGITVTVNSNPYRVKTYTDGNCSLLTTGTSSLVRCVGTIVPN